MSDTRADGTVPMDVYLGWLKAATELNEFVKPEPPKPEPRPGRAGERRPGDTQPGDDFNRRGTWEDTGLFAAGWTRVRHLDDDRGFVRRPGKPDGVSGTLGICTSTEHDWPLFYCFTTSDPRFAADASYSRFGVYTILNHGGDFSAAARALAGMGYGTPWEQQSSTALVPVAPAVPAVSLERCAELLAKELEIERECIAAVEENIKQGVECFRRIGNILLNAKRHCAHGEWLPWLERHFPKSERQARNYMALAGLPPDTDVVEQWARIQGNSTIMRKSAVTADLESEALPAVPLLTQFSALTAEIGGTLGDTKRAKFAALVKKIDDLLSTPEQEAEKAEEEAEEEAAEGDEPEEEPDTHPYEKMALKLIADTRAMNDLLNSSDLDPKTLQDYCRENGVAGWFPEEGRYRFLALLGVPGLLSAAIAGTDPIATVQYKFKIACGQESEAARILKQKRKDEREREKQRKATETRKAGAT